MEIWLPELPDIQISRVLPPDPDEHDLLDRAGRPRTNPYVNGAFWHLTFQLILNRLTPTQ